MITFYFLFASVVSVLCMVIVLRAPSPLTERAS